MEKVNVERSVTMLQKNKLENLESNFEYLHTLNYEQKIAASTINGNILVLAGPGSGKTHTLAYRIIHMLNSGINPQEIVLITFTRKAANEIKQRVQRLVGNVELGFIGTFHAFAIRLSNEHQINKGWRVLDTEDDLVLLKMVISENEISFRNKITNKTVLKIISYSANTRLSIEESLIKLGREDLKDDVEKLLITQKKYNAYKKKNKYMSYDDVIDSIIFKLGSRYIKYKYLMIDEYQDTNQMQLEFIKSLSIGNIMAIGDDFQGIYSFRGADPNIILNFYNDFTDAKLIVLKVNYRSDIDIVNVLNDVTDEAAIGFSKELISNSKNKGSVSIEKLPNDYYNEIIKFHLNNPSEKTAFIYRANRDKTDLEKELILRKIDYVVYGGIRLLERKHIKDIFAYLLVSKNKNDLISYLRVLLLLDGFGEKTAKNYLDNNDYKSKERTDIKELEEVLNYKGNLIEHIDLIIKFYSQLNKPKKTCNYTEEEINNDYIMIKELAKGFDDVVNFINDIILNGSVDLYSRKNVESKLILTTIHSAKGLEFDNVFHLYSRPNFGGYDIESLEENRRLFYVAISRAKKKLIVWNFTYLESVNLHDILNDFKITYSNSSEQLKFHYENFGEGSTNKHEKKSTNLKQKKKSFFSRIFKR